MLTPIRIHDERCDLCGGNPACIPACPQQILRIGDHRVVMTHTDRCPEGCTVCVEACNTHAFSLVEQVHTGLGTVAAERVRGAARVHHVAYLRGEQEEEKRIRDRFAALCDELKLPEDQRSIGETRAHAWGDAPGGTGHKLQLTWELHTEY
jgi:Fe-S-cluster-containing hydrogenase component 2